MRNEPEKHLDIDIIRPLDIPMVNLQVETAKKYPRPPETEICKHIEEIIEADVELAELCYYEKPVGKGPDGIMKYVPGPSVRLAEFIASTWQNLLVQITPEETPTGVEARFRVYDPEKNFAVEGSVKRNYVSNKPQSKQNIYNGAVSIAFRNGILKVVPRAIAEKLWKKAQERVLRDATGVESDRLTKLYEHYKKYNISVATIRRLLGVKVDSEITAEHIAKLRGVATALKDGDLTTQELEAATGLEQLAAGRFSFKGTQGPGVPIPEHVEPTSRHPDGEAGSTPRSPEPEIDDSLAASGGGEEDDLSGAEGVF